MKNELIGNRILDVFPGYIGQFLYFNFSRFLNMPISTKKQEAAYQNLINYLDALPALHFSKEVQQFLEEHYADMSIQKITKLLDDMELIYSDPLPFIQKHEEIIHEYNEFKKSAQYENSIIYQLQTSLKEYMSNQDYYTTFIPLMCQLSPAYQNYQEKIKAAEKTIQDAYPNLIKQ